jgi:hypothetical protein
MLDESKIAELKAAHGDRLIAVESEAGPLVFRAPNRAEYGRFVDSVNGDVKNAKLSGYTREFVMACSVHPDKPATSAAFDRQPGLVMKVSEKLNELAGAGDTVDVKNL